MIEDAMRCRLEDWPEDSDAILEPPAERAFRWSRGQPAVFMPSNSIS